MVKCASAFALIKCMIDGSVMGVVRCGEDIFIFHSPVSTNRRRFQLIHDSAHTTQSHGDEVSSALDTFAIG
jgi:hypothetical protein